MATNVISEFLVKIGFKVDDAARAKLDANITKTGLALQNFARHASNATQQFETFGKRVVIASVATAAALAAFTKRLEDAFFFAQRTGASGAQRSALELAFQNIGVAAGQASASVKNLAEQLRYNPEGTRGILAAIGVQADDASGKLRNTIDIYLDTLEALSKLNPYAKSAFLRSLGISLDEQTQYENNRERFIADLKERRAELEKLYKVLGINEKAGNDFASALRRLLQNLELIAIAVVSGLIGGNGSLVELNKWLVENAKTIVDKVVVALQNVWKVLTETIIPAFKWVIDFLIDLDKKTDGWSTKLIALLVVLNALGVTSLIGGVISLAGALASLGGALAALSGVGVVAGLAILGKAAVAAAAIAGTIYVVKEVGDKLDDLNERAKMKNRKKGAGNNANAAAIGNPNAGLNLGGEAKNRAQAAVDYFQSQGWTREQAIGIVANIFKESSFNEKALGDGGNSYGLAQWSQTRQADFREWAGKDITKSTFEEQLAFIQHELTQGKERPAGTRLRMQSTTTGSAGVVSQYYERPAAQQAEIAHRGQIAQNLEKSTVNNFNVVMHVQDGTNAVQEINKMSYNAARKMVAAR